MDKLRTLRTRIETDLVRRQLPCGGWSYSLASRQASLEPTTLALMAVRDTNAQGRAVLYLVRAQNSNGSWPSFAGDDDQGSWATSLALIALRSFFNTAQARVKGAQWLLSSAGREAHWLWRWKFRLFDRHARFDPLKYGWPWNPDTNSWVVPTAFAILALKSLPSECGLTDYSHRIALGISMLLDRACPGGGWNSGNGIVYGSALTPHPDDTGVALLALKGEDSGSIVASGLDWLERAAPKLPPSTSLALSILALSVYQRPVRSLVDRFLSTSRPLPSDAASVALTALAIDAVDGTNIFGESL
jgi:hypothetical protein